MKASVQVIKESYKHYRFKNDRYKVSADYAEYKVIAELFFKKLFEKLVTTGFLIELPSRMGSFILEQYSTEKFQSDLDRKGKTLWARDIQSETKHFKTYGYKKKIIYDSSDTDGKMWIFSWLKGDNGVFRTKHLFTFNLVRSNVRSTSNKEYSEHSKRLTVHDFFKERGHKLYRYVYRTYYNNNLPNNVDDANN